MPPFATVSTVRSSEAVANEEVAFLEQILTPGTPWLSPSTSSYISLKGYGFLSKQHHQHQAAPATTYTIYTIEFRWISGRVGLSNFCQVLLPFLPYDLICVVFSIYAVPTPFTHCLCCIRASPDVIILQENQRSESIRFRLWRKKSSHQKSPLSLGPPTLSFYWLLYLQYIFWTSKKKSWVTSPLFIHPPMAGLQLYRNLAGPRVQIWKKSRT